MLFMKRSMLAKTIAFAVAFVAVMMSMLLGGCSEAGKVDADSSNAPDSEEENKQEQAQQDNSGQVITENGMPNFTELFKASDDDELRSMLESVSIYDIDEMGVYFSSTQYREAQMDADHYLPPQTGEWRLGTANFHLGILGLNVVGADNADKAAQTIADATGANTVYLREVGYGWDGYFFSDDLCGRCSVTEEEISIEVNQYPNDWADDGFADFQTESQQQGMEVVEYTFTN